MSHLGTFLNLLRLEWQGVGRTQSTTKTISTLSAQTSRSDKSYRQRGQLLGVPRFSANQLTRFQTSAVTNDTCLPTPLPPKCGPKICALPKPNIFKDCKLKKRPKWTGCEKICMPCCCPAYDPPDCDSIEIRQNTCKRPEYRIPSFSECRKFPMGVRQKKECCYITCPCPEAGIETIIEPLISVRVRQETLLGRRKGKNVRNFSTSAVTANKNDCKKKGVLPCLKPSGMFQKKIRNKNCPKQCMPCCRPARDPPECHYPYQRAECNRPKPPRPAFSECDKEKVKSIPECECIGDPLPPCKGAIGSSASKSC